MVKRIRKVLFTPTQTAELAKAKETSTAHKPNILLCAYVPLKHKHNLPYVDDDGSEGPCEHEPCPCKAALKYATNKLWFEESNS